MGKKVRLESVGYFDEAIDAGTESAYERPVMMVYTGKFDSMDGEVTILESHIDLLVKNHNSVMERVKRLANGGIPMKDCPPLQLDHSTSATHTIGRLVGPLSKGTIDIDGKPQVALFGVAKFLGRENVEKAKDGRWTHVSIGADLEDGIINELSVTPFPAAPRASLLSKNNESKGEQKMHEKLKKHLMEHRKMSEQDAEKLSKECLAHHMKHLGLDEEKMGKHMAEAKDEDVKNMSEEYDKAMSKLAADPAEAEKDEKEKKEKEAKMAAKTDFVKLALGMKKGNVELRMELKKTTIAARLSRLRSEAKITPAEVKKLDIVKMSDLSDEALEAALSTFDSREPVLRFGSMHGTSKGEAIDKITKKYRLAKMELESRLNMPSKRVDAQKQLSKLIEQEKVELASVGNSNENETPSKGMLTKLTYDEMCLMLDDKGKHEELKRHLKHMMDHHGLEIPEQSDSKMSALAKKQSELQNSLEQLIALASPALGIQPEEIK